MRLSADDSDPGYLAFVSLGPNHRWLVDVFLDGDLIEGAVTADDVEGTVTTYAKREEDGEFVVRQRHDGGREPVKIVRHGKVKIFVREP